MNENINSIIIVCLLALAAFAGVAMGEPTMNKAIENNRNYEYEYYCDSLWIVNPDYYNDVLIETDEYQQYIDQNGQWWDN